MIKTADMNQEALRKRVIEILGEYPKPDSITKMKEIVQEYDKVRELLHETLNISMGIMEAVSNKEIKDKKEEESLVKEIKKELEARNYLGGIN